MAPASQFEPCRPSVLRFARCMDPQQTAKSPRTKGSSYRRNFRYVKEYPDRGMRPRPFRLRGGLAAALHIESGQNEQIALFAWKRCGRQSSTNPPSVVSSLTRRAGLNAYLTLAGYNPG
jgi:hypothetical protein